MPEQLLSRGEGLLARPRHWALPPRGKVTIIASPSVPQEPLQALQDALEGNARLLSFSTRLLGLSEIEELARRMRLLNGSDFLIAVGGGSLLDAVKAVRHFDSTLAGVPLVAVPTTVGSGSEATPFAAYFVDGKKRSVEDPGLRPEGVVLDAALLASLPLSVVRSSMLDSFCQACESTWSLRATARSRERALGALAILREEAGAGVSGERHALGRLLLAAHMAGQAIAESRTTLAHALSYPLTARFGMPHGEAVAIHLPLAARLLEEAVSEGATHSETRAALEALRTVLNVRRGTLSEALAGFIRSVGGKAALFESSFVTRKDANELSLAALSSPRAGNYPLALDAATLRDALLRDLAPDAPD